MDSLRLGANPSCQSQTGHLCALLPPFFTAHWPQIMWVRLCLAAFAARSLVPNAVTCMGALPSSLLAAAAGRQTNKEAAFQRLCYLGDTHSARRGIR